MAFMTYQGQRLKNKLSGCRKAFKHATVHFTENFVLVELNIFIMFGYRFVQPKSLRCGNTVLEKSQVQIQLLKASTNIANLLAQSQQFTDS